MHDEASNPSRNTTFITFFSMDQDILLFKAVCGVVVASIVWPLGLLGYLVTVYGIRILASQ